MATAATTAPSVVVEDLAKTFRLPHERVHTVKERALHPFRRRRHDKLEALREVSFEVRPGEFFGVVGRNGSGKSTLLKCLAGIYRADTGRIGLRGRMAPFIELGVGFNPDLTAHDNVVLNAVMLGLTPAEARRRFDAVIEFAELEEFVDLKLKNYSSGMYVRLAFSVMVQVDADILLIDEVLAVGDAAFQQKCHDTLDRMRAEGRTVVFVTHDMNTVERKCDRAMLLERGAMVDLADPQRVARKYNELNFGGGPVTTLDGERQGDGAARVLEAWFADAEGRRVPTLERGAAAFGMLVEIERQVENPSFGVAIEDEAHRTIFTTTSEGDGKRFGSFSPGERAQVELRFENVLAPGPYLATPFVTHSGTGAKLMDSRRRMVPVTVLGTRRGTGLVELPHEFALTREREPAAEAAGRGSP
jgi:ABC-type polysaccharide/polyol phosphate transport system ATPase subunit